MFRNEFDVVSCQHSPVLRSLSKYQWNKILESLCLVFGNRPSHQRSAYWCQAIDDNRPVLNQPFVENDENTFQMLRIYLRSLAIDLKWSFTFELNEMSYFKKCRPCFSNNVCKQDFRVCFEKRRSRIHVSPQIVHFSLPSFCFASRYINEKWVDPIRYHHPNWSL